MTRNAHSGPANATRNPPTAGAINRIRFIPAAFKEMAFINCPGLMMLGMIAWRDGIISAIVAP